MVSHDSGVTVVLQWCYSDVARSPPLAVTQASETVSRDNTVTTVQQHYTSNATTVYNQCKNSALAWYRQCNNSRSYKERSCVTVVLHWRYTGVKLVLRWCHSVVAVMLPLSPALSVAQGSDAHLCNPHCNTTVALM
jgi:hypothetical protein